MKHPEAKVELELRVIDLDIIQKAFDVYEPADDGEAFLIELMEKKFIELSK